MNKDEKIISNTLYGLVSDYESADNNDLKNDIFKKINEISASEVERDFLDNYWRSIDIKEFCQIHSIIKVDIKDQTKSEIHNYLKSIVDNVDDFNTLDYFLIKYSDSIEYFYKKNSGTLINLIYQDDINELDKVLKELEKPDIIIL